MATTCTYVSYGAAPGGGTQCSVVSGTISQADMGFLNISDPTTPAVATVTADKVRTHLVGAAAAVTAGIPPGQYERVGAATYKKV